MRTALVDELRRRFAPLPVESPSEEDETLRGLAKMGGVR